MKILKGNISKGVGELRKMFVPSESAPPAPIPPPTARPFSPTSERRAPRATSRRG